MTDTRLDELRARVAALAAKAPAVPAAPTRTGWREPDAGGRLVSAHLHDPADMVRGDPVQRCTVCGQEWVLLERGGHRVLYARDYQGDWPAVPFGSKERE